jgi:hypothetical protein
VRFGGGSIPERGRECAEVVVDGSVVGGAAADDHVGPGVRAELLVDPRPLGVRARHREHDGRRSERFEARPRPDVQDAEVAKRRSGRGGLSASC